MLKFLMFGFYGIACAMLLVLTIGSVLTAITTVVLAVLKLTNHLDHSWIVVFSPILVVASGWILFGVFGLLGLVFSPILVVASGWILCGVFGLLGLVCQVSINK